MHELSIAPRDRRHRRSGTPTGGAVTAVQPARRARCARSCPDSLDFYFEIVARDTRLRGRALEQELIAGAAALRALRARVGARGARVPLPGAAPAAMSTSCRGDELEVESIEVEEEAACTA